MPEQIPAAVRKARTEVAKMVTERDRLIATGARAGAIDRDRLVEIDSRIGGLLDDILVHVDPCDASEAEPLVLLPVRLETRFGHEGQSTTLQVRIYPDEIHVDALMRGLSAKEIAAGRLYWTVAWTDPVPEGAWDALVASVAPDRAEWVAHVCTPKNLAERGPTATPDFDEPTPHRASATPSRGCCRTASSSSPSRAARSPKRSATRSPGTCRSRRSPSTTRYPR